MLTPSLPIFMKIHFIGIGGIGVSALAQYYLNKGAQVSGSDLASSEIIKILEDKGAKIFIGKHRAGNLPTDVERVIYSPAVKPVNSEFKKARKLQTANSKLKILSYPEALGELTKKYFTIAVAGTHGKSTTTAMLALILIKAGLDPTVIVGTKLKEFGNSNFYSGKSKYLVIEACEHEESFLHYRPKTIVLTNIEEEHLDYYKNLDNVLRAFKKFIKYLPKEGVLVANRDDGNIQGILNPKSKIQMPNQIQNPNAKIQKYSLNQKKDVQKLKKILKVPGEHNVYNALAALTAARALKISDKISYKALSEYKGCWRRFEIKRYNIQDTRYKIQVISDYAHHPTEVKATLKATREKFSKKNIWCIFQPHQYQRTFYLFDDFVKVFSKAMQEKWIDKLIIADIYDVAGRENKQIKKQVSSKKLARCIDNKATGAANKAMHISNITKITNYLNKNLNGGEVVVIMGAGDIYKLLDHYTRQR